MVFEILVQASRRVASFGYRSRSSFPVSGFVHLLFVITSFDLRLRHLDSMLALILGFCYFYAELLRLELQMLIHPEDCKLSKFLL